MSKVKIEHLDFSYKEGRKILDDVSFEVGESSLISLLGANGVGKSTLFKCMLGLLKKYKGNIYLNDENITEMSVKKMANEIAYIPQSHFPVFNFTVKEMILMGTSAKVKSTSQPKKEQFEQVERVAEKMGIQHILNRDYVKISGGERQLVLIARALAQQTKILIMDEPTSNLDYGNQLMVLSAVKELSQVGYTIILSTHHPDQAFLYADRVLALWEGKLLADGLPNDVITPETVKKLYGVDVVIPSLYNDRIKMCVAKHILEE